MHDAIDAPSARRAAAVRRALLHGAGLVLVVVVAVLALRFVDARGVRLPPCPLWATTGLFCPGCGSTRALKALVHLDVVGAWRANPLLMIALPFLAASAVRHVVVTAVAPEAPRRLRPLLGRLIFVVVVVFALARNVASAPLCRLSPDGEGCDDDASSTTSSTR
jgi:hypothetical protein